MARADIQPTDARRCRSGALFTDHQATVWIKGHAIGHVGGSTHGYDGLWCQREAVAGQADLPDRDLFGVGDRDMAAGRQRREVQRILGLHVHRPLVGVGFDDRVELRVLARNLVKLVGVRDEMAVNGLFARGEVGHWDLLSFAG
jgi:hypothetical protein